MSGNTDYEWPLNEYEKWCVRSNLLRIKEESLDGAEVVALVRANGYPRVALAIEQVLAQIDSSGNEDDHRYNPAPFCAKCGGPCEMQNDSHPTCSDGDHVNDDNPGRPMCKTCEDWHVGERPDTDDEAPVLRATDDPDYDEAEQQEAERN